MMSNMNGLNKDYHIKWSQRKTSIVWYHLHGESKKWYKWTNLQNKQTSRGRKQTYGYQSEKGVDEG